MLKSCDCRYVTGISKYHRHIRGGNARTVNVASGPLITPPPVKMRPHAKRCQGFEHRKMKGRRHLAVAIRHWKHTLQFSSTCSPTAASKPGTETSAGPSCCSLGCDSRARRSAMTLIVSVSVLSLSRCLRGGARDCWVSQRLTDSSNSVCTSFGVRVPEDM